MTKRRSEPRDNRKQRRIQASTFDGQTPFSLHNTRAKRDIELKPKNDSQALYLKLIDGNPLTFGLGPAGTGKTFLAAWKAAEHLGDKKVERIIVTRPIVEAGEELGFLPGELADKIAPYFTPVREALERRLGRGSVEYMLKDGTLEFVPLAYMRGRTFDDAYVILDEAQNTTPKQMKLFLTRVGERTRLIVNGDLLQSDIAGPNGLYDAVERLRGLKGVGVMKFSRDDVVRSGLARVIVDAYEGQDAPPLPAFITGINSDGDRADSSFGRLPGQHPH